MKKLYFLGGMLLSNSSYGGDVGCSLIKSVAANYTVVSKKTYIDPYVIGVNTVKICIDDGGHGIIDTVTSPASADLIGAGGNMNGGTMWVTLNKTSDTVPCTTPGASSTSRMLTYVDPTGTPWNVTWMSTLAFSFRTKSAIGNGNGVIISQYAYKNNSLVKTLDTTTKPVSYNTYTTTLSYQDITTDMIPDETVEIPIKYSINQNVNVTPSVNYKILPHAVDGIKMEFATGGVEFTTKDPKVAPPIRISTDKSIPSGAFSRQIDVTVTCP